VCVSLSLCPSIYICPSLCPFIHVCLSVTVCLSVCLCTCLFVCQCVSLSVCVFICLFVWLSVPALPFLCLCLTCFGCILGLYHSMVTSMPWSTSSFIMLPLHGAQQLNRIQYRADYCHVYENLREGDGREMKRGKQKERKVKANIFQRKSKKVPLIMTESISMSAYL
jgi:hypothetical protein